MSLLLSTIRITEKLTSVLVLVFNNPGLARTRESVHELLSLLVNLRLALWTVGSK